MYDADDLDQAAEQHADLITELAEKRRAWMVASVRPQDARDRLRWSRDEFAQVARERGIEPGRFGRYALADIDALAADTGVDERIRNRLLGPEQAAEHLEVRRVDFDYAVTAGWIRPADHIESQVSRRRWVTVPLYRTADVEALRDIPGIDWEQIRAARPGKPSPLRKYAALPTPRGVLVRGFAADLADQYGAAATARYLDLEDRWELSWSPTLPDGRDLTAATVRAMFSADPALAPHADHVTFTPDEETSYQ